MIKLIKYIKTWWFWTFTLKKHITVEELSKLSLKKLAQLQEELGLLSPKEGIHNVGTLKGGKKVIWEDDGAHLL